MNPLDRLRNHQKMFKPDFFRWVKSGKVNQATLVDVTRWLTRAGESAQQRDTLDGMWEPTDNQEEVPINMYRGQRSNAVLATEFLPMIRLLKRQGQGESTGTVRLAASPCTRRSPVATFSSQMCR
jgi:hypothetical protein